MPKIKHYENVHIPLWLLKDTCWVMQWKLFGIIMIVPTIIVALIITIKCYREKDIEFWVHLAVLFWISGNSYWMLCEFFNHEELKYYTVVPFAAGILSVVYFYKKYYFLKNNN